MSQKRKIIEITQRERDIFDYLHKFATVVLDSTVVRICAPPAEIRDFLKEKYPDIKVFHVTSSLKNLEEAGLIVRIREAGTGEIVRGIKQPSTYEINKDFYLDCEIRIITKRKTGYKAGSFKKPPTTIDNTKTILKEARQLLGEKKQELGEMAKKSLTLRKNLENHEKLISKVAREARILEKLLAIKNKNLRQLGLI